MLVLWLLSDFVFTGGYTGEYLLSPVLSFQAAVSVNFNIFFFYVWKDRVADVLGVGTYLRRYLTYNLSCSTVFLLRYGILQLIGQFTGWDVLLCNLCAMCVSGILNFLLANNLVFRKTK